LFVRWHCSTEFKFSLVWIWAMPTSSHAGPSLGIRSGIQQSSFAGYPI
jgi:hypothetical protein